MRVVLQRVTEARVEVAGRVTGAIGRGLLLFVGIGPEDSEATVTAMADKAARLRVFEDDAGKLNLSALDLGLEVLIVSQFNVNTEKRPPDRIAESEEQPTFGRSRHEDTGSVL